MLRELWEPVWDAVGVPSWGLHAHCDPHQPEGSVRIQKEDSLSVAARAEGSLPANTADCYWCCSQGSKGYGKACQRQEAPCGYFKQQLQKGEGKKRRVRYLPPQRGNMSAFSLRTEVVSMLIITKENLTGFTHLHDRTLPVSLLGLGSLFCSVFQQIVKSSVLP